jgi:hypothetical protein
MELFGGTVLPMLFATQKIFGALAGNKGLTDLQLMLQIPGHHTQYVSALLFEGDTTIDADFVVNTEEKWITKNKISLIACIGNLTIKKDLLNVSYDYWPAFVVTGNLSARNVVHGAMPLVVGGDLVASGYCVPQFNDGPLRVGGNLWALGYLPECPDRDGIKGHQIAGKIEAPIFDLRQSYRSRDLLPIFTEKVIKQRMLDIDEIIKFGKKGKSIWLTPEESAKVVIPEEVTPPAVPTLAPADPSKLGSIEPQDGMKSRLEEITRKHVPKGDWDNPARLLEPFDWALESPDEKFLVLPPNTIIDGDLILDWNAPWVQQAKLAGVVCMGDLTIKGTIRNECLDGGPILFVAGDLHVEHILKGGAPVSVVGNLVASGLIFAEYNHGTTRVGRNLTAKTCMFLDHDARVFGEVNAAHYINDGDHETVDFEDWHDVVVDTAFPDEDEERPDSKLIWAHHKLGMPLFKDEL